MFACHTQFYCVHDIILVVFLLLPIRAARSKKEEKEKSEGGSNIRRGAEGGSHAPKTHEKTVDGAKVVQQGDSRKED